METSRYTERVNIPFKISQLILILGLGGIGISLLYNSIPVFILISLIPLLCVGSILLLRYPWFILFVIFTINYFILGISRYVSVEGISVIMEILYVLALVLIFIQAALFQNIEWRRAINILSITLCVWTGYCILEIINPTASLEGWIPSGCHNHVPYIPPSHLFQIINFRWFPCCLGCISFHLCFHPLIHFPAGFTFLQMEPDLTVCCFRRQAVRIQGH